MKHWIRKICAFVLVLLPVLGAVTAQAAGSSVTYEGNARDFIFTPGGGSAPADLFASFKDVMPGDVLTDSIEVRGIPAKGTSLNLYLRTDGILRETAPGFLEQIRLRVAGSGGTLFDGTLDTAAGWIRLGNFRKGDLEQLILTLTVPIEMGNDCQDALGAIRWRFLAEEIPDCIGTTCPPCTCPTGGCTCPTAPRPTDSGKGLPKTGDRTPIGLMAAVFLTTGTALACLAGRRRKAKRER